MFLSTNKSKLAIFSMLLVSMTSCCASRCAVPECCCQESVDIPCHWHTPLEHGINDDPPLVHWWEAFDDPNLTELIEQVVSRNQDVLLAHAHCQGTSLETVNSTIAETAKSYFELRGLYERLKIVQTAIETQYKKQSLDEGLSKLSALEENINRNNLDALLIQKSFIELSIKKVIFHLSTLLSYAPGEINLNFCESYQIPKIPCDIPIGFPMEVVERHPAVQEAKKTYVTTCSNEAFYSYQKQVLNVLEEAENALASFSHSLEKIHYLENSTNIKKESYQMIQDLHQQGFKEEQEILTTYKDLLTQQNALNESYIELLINYVNLQHALGVGWEIN